MAFENWRYHGLAKMNDAALVTTCVDRSTTNMERLTAAEIEAANGVFLGCNRDLRP